MLIPNTPEAYLPRSDSKNAATTCKGITSKGRPCRRSLATSPKKESSVSNNISVSAVAPTNVHTVATASYCWQHKDQAEQHSARSGTKLTPLQKRNSIDTLVSRLGIINIQDSTEPECNTSKNKRGTKNAKQSARYKDQGSMSSVPKEVLFLPPTSRSRPFKPQGFSKKQRKPSFLAMLCCTGIADEDDYLETVRHRKRTQRYQRPEMSTATPSAKSARDLYESTKSKPYNNITPRPHNSNPQQLSPTSKLMSFIPQTLPPITTSLLLNELVKPISNHDDSGYIYMFWLTDSNIAPPSDTITSSLLSASPPSQPRGGGRQAEILQQFKSNAPGSKNTILLKIGRASNVHRRLSEWTRQCGYNLSLIRFYPYVPSASLISPNPLLNATTPPLSPANNISKAPHVHRVERLIHIELAEKRVKQAECGMCGKEHREWFEVEASTEGLRSVDEVVRRWVAWAEGLDGERFM